MTVNERETTEISRSLLKLATSSVLTETRLLNPHRLIFSRSDERCANRAFFYSLFPFFCKDRPLQIQNQGARGIEKEKLSRSRGPGFCSPSQAFLPSFRSLSRPRLQLPPRGPIFFFSLSDPWYVCSSTPISPLLVSLDCKERRASKQAFGDGPGGVLSSTSLRRLFSTLSRPLALAEPKEIECRLSSSYSSFAPSWSESQRRVRRVVGRSGPLRYRSRRALSSPSPCSAVEKDVMRFHS